MRKNNKGFTLIEMLIVVAIIAILVAVSIPLVNGSLERARIATDAANERSAKAEVLLKYVMGDTVGSSVVTHTTKYNYDAETGDLKAESDKPEGYGKCSAHKDGYVQVSITKGTEEVTVTWQGTSGGKTDPHGFSTKPIS